jgi:hypothetical protein
VREGGAMGMVGSESNHAYRSDGLRWNKGPGLMRINK